MPRPDLTGHDNYWIPIDVAAAALQVTTAQAYVIAHRDRWRRTNTRPRQYLMADVKTTAQRRRKAPR